MSTFMAHACIDLHPDEPTEAVLAALQAAMGSSRSVDVATTVAPDGGRRLLLFADWANVWLDETLMQAARTCGGMIARMLVALNHDEYGVEHVVLGIRDGGPVRVHHVYVHPLDEEGDPGEGGAGFADVPMVGETESSAPGGILDGPGPRGRAADLFGVPAAAMEAAAERNERAHEDLCTVFTPHAHWWEALKVTDADGEAPVVTLKGTQDDH